MSKDKKIVARECRFAVHIPARKGYPDIHYVKERVHYEDGTSEPNVRLHKDFKRPFWVANLSKRNHSQKKEYESVENLMKFECTQSDLRDEVAKALGKLHTGDHLKKLSQSPYLYGSDITSTALIKHQYIKTWPNKSTPYSIAFFDIETDVLYGTEDPIVLQITFQGKVYIFVTKDFIAGLANVQEEFHRKMKIYLGEHLEEHKFEVELIVCEDTIDAIAKSFAKLHELKPDFLSIWNMNFDIPRILKTLEKYNVDPKTILCDPKVPYDLRICKYKQGIQKKVKSSGIPEAIEPSKQWHTLVLTASFYVIDAMCVYRQIRMAGQQEQSYGLDAILKKEIDSQKLKFSQADGYIGLKWHQVMQSKYKLEYLCYAAYDSIGMALLDAKTKDLAYTVPSSAGITDFAKFNSNPKKITDALHNFVLEKKGYVMGTVGSEEKVEDDAPEMTLDDDEEVDPDADLNVLSLSSWIVTLPAHMSMLGLPLIEEDESILTNIRAFTYDSDCISAYPTCVSILNVSMQTCKREIIDIDGIPEELFRMQNINLMTGNVNALEYGQYMFGLPSAFNVLQYI